MFLAAYFALVAAALALSTVAMVPAVLIGLLAAVLVFRAELHWIARRARPPRVMLTPAPQAMPQREGS